jgi:hypothetical protein
MSEPDEKHDTDRCPPPEFEVIVEIPPYFDLSSEALDEDP